MLFAVGSVTLKVVVKPSSVAPWKTSASWPSNWLVRVSLSVVALPIIVLPFTVKLLLNVPSPAALILKTAVPTPACLTSKILAVWLLAPWIVAVTLPTALL